VFVLPNLLSLGVILGAVIIGVLASLLSERGEAKSAEAKSAQNSDAT